jgi:hypothetical protein
MKSAPVAMIRRKQEDARRTASRMSDWMVELRDEIQKFRPV